MASAGRILIMPKGAYNPNATYEMLDMVSHNGTTWLAKKTVSGIAPSDGSNEFWHNMFNASAESLGAIPKQEQGQAAYSFNLMENYNLPTFVRWDSNTLNSPYKSGATDCAEGFAIVFGDVASYHTITAWTKGGRVGNIFVHCVDGGVASGWGTFLSDGGGMLKGNVTIQKQMAEIVLKESDTRGTILQKSSNDAGDFGSLLVDISGNVMTVLTLQNGKLILHKHVNGVDVGSVVVAEIMV